MLIVFSISLKVMAMTVVTNKGQLTQLEVVLVQEKESLRINFSNIGQTEYFIDEKLALKDGVMTLSFLKVTHAGLPIDSKMAIKASPSKFPDEFIKIDVGETYTVDVGLSAIFEVSDFKSVRVEFDGINSLPDGELDFLTSNPITFEIDTH